MTRSKKTPKEKGIHALLFISIIYGLCVIQFFESWSLVLHTGTFRVLFVPPTILTITASLLLIEFWWASYEFTEVIGSSFPNFLVSILETLLFFLGGSVLKGVFENSHGDIQQLFAAYLSKSHIIYGLGIALQALFLLEDLKRKTIVADVFRIIGIILCLVPIFSKSVAIHYIVPYLTLAAVLSFTTFRTSVLLKGA